MSNGLKLALAWLVTVVVALAFSWGAIAQVRNQVIQPATEIPTSVVAAPADPVEDTPAAPPTTLEVIDPVAVGSEASTTTVVDEGASTSSAPSTNSVSSTESTATTVGGGSDSSGAVTSTTVPTVSGSSPTTSSASPTRATSSTTSSTSTTSTTSAPVTQTSTFTLVGGAVTISYSLGVVTYVNAIPAFGFSTDVDGAGPKEVRVNFESEDHTSEFRAKWEGDELDIDIDENEGNSDKD